MRVDDALCTTCSLCAEICSLLRKGEVNEARSAVRIERDPFAGRERVLVCLDCDERACIPSCAAGALGLAGGFVRIDPDRCDLCLACVAACPHGGVQVWRDPVSGRPLSIEICDGCGGEFPCVPFCATGAISGRPREAKEEESSWASR